MGGYRCPGMLIFGSFTIKRQRKSEIDPLVVIWPSHACCPLGQPACSFILQMISSQSMMQQQVGRLSPHPHKPAGVGHPVCSPVVGVARKRLGDSLGRMRQPPYCRMIPMAFPLMVMGVKVSLVTRSVQSVHCIHSCLFKSTPVEPSQSHTYLCIIFTLILF